MGEEAGLPAARATIVVDSPLAARQWEAHLATREAADAHVWETRPIRTYSAWLEQLWLAAAPAEPTAILSAAQSAALWRRVVAESPAGEALLGHAGAAEWAAAAASLLRRWRVEPATLRAARREIDFRAFLDWDRRYRALLSEHGWRDGGDLEGELLARAIRPEAVVSADLGELYPARAALFEHLARGGSRIIAEEVPRLHGRRRTVCLADSSHEARAAFAWARRRLAERPRAKLAIVVPDLDYRRDEIGRAADVELRAAEDVPLWIDHGALLRDPAIGAAVNALSLLARGTRYAAFGRWLRSPFFGASAELPLRAQLDRKLREQLVSHVTFAEAYRRCGLRETLRERVPLAAAVLARALAEVEDVTRAAPSRWAHLWSRYLTALDWHAPPTRAALLGWQSVLDEVARLTPILGEVSREDALAELERIVERAALVEPLPLHGVHVLRRIDDVGPGYDGAWAAGFTDAAWPEPPRGNPLLPTALQRELGLPYCTPQDAERRSTIAFSRLVERAGDLVVSWSSRVYDYETEPSPAIVGWEPLSAAEVDELTAPRARAALRREMLVDSPPPFAGGRLHGGTAALGRQARCPIRAFCQDRLGAKSLEPLRFGLDARLRGIAAHRAAELLLVDLPTQAALLAKPRTALLAAAEGALDEIFAGVRFSLRRFRDLELGQLERELAALVEAERARAPFKVRAVEETREVVVERLSLKVRVDRLDELGDGTLAVLDYKTNERASGADWFAPRLRDAQVPLYAAHATEIVSAAVIARLSTEAPGYAGLWQGSAFPGRRSPGALEDIPAQLALWRSQVAALANEFATGDVRILLADYEEALGAFAPLTRIHEQLGLASGTTPRW